MKLQGKKQLNVPVNSNAGSRPGDPNAHPVAGWSYPLQRRKKKSRDRKFKARWGSKEERRRKTRSKGKKKNTLSE
jgi:hypothetical protein